MSSQSQITQWTDNPGTPASIQTISKRPRSSSTPEKEAEKAEKEVSNADIVKMITSLQLGIGAEFKSFKVEVAAEFKSVGFEFKGIHERVEGIHDSIQNQFGELKTEVANLSSSVSTLSQKQAELSAENAMLKEELAAIRRNIAIIEEKQRVSDEKQAAALEAEIANRDDLEAQQRRYNITISGITKLDKNEDCIRIANDFLKKLVPAHDPKTLDICHRTAGGQLICRFTSRSARDAIYAARKQLKDRTTSDYGLPGNDIKNKLYVNESLTFLRG